MSFSITSVIYPFLRFWRASIWPLKVFYVTLFLYALLALSLPPFLKMGIEKALLAQGIQQVSLSGVQVQLLRGRIDIEQLTLTNPDNQPLILGGVTVDLSWLGLLQKQLRLNLVELDNTQILVVLEPNQWIEIAGIRIPLKSEVTSAQAKKPALAFSLGLDALMLNNTKVLFKTPEFERTLIIDKLRLTELYNWQTNQAARLQFEMQLLQAMTQDNAVLKGDLKLHLFSDTQSVSGTLKLVQLALQNQQVFLPKTLGTLAGNWVSNVTFKLTNDQGKIHLENTAGITLTNFELAQPQQTLALNSLQWIGNSVADLNAGHLSLQYDAQLSLKDARFIKDLNVEETLQTSLKQADLHLKQTLSGDVFQDVQTLLSNFDNQLVLQNLEVRLPQKAFSLDGLKVAAQGQANIKAGVLDLQMQNQQSLQGLHAQAEGLDADLAEQTWLGSLSLTNPNLQSEEMASLMQLSTRGDLAIQDLRLNQTQQQLKVLEVKRFSTQLQLAEDKQLALKKTMATEVVFAQPDSFEAPLVYLQALKISAINLSAQQDIRVGTVALNGLQVEALITPNKKIAQLEPVLALSVQTPVNTLVENSNSTEEAIQSSATQKKEVTPNNPQPKNAFAIAQLTISPNSQFKLITQATQPQMQTQVSVKGFDVGSLNSAQPQFKTPIEIDLLINQYTQVSVKGFVVPLSQKVNAQFDVQINDLDLYAFSPLIQPDLGMKIQSGGLSMKNSVQIQNSILDSQNKLKLIGFELMNDPIHAFSTTSEAKEAKETKIFDEASTSAETGGNLSGSTISLALDLLRDGDNNIELDVPIKGDLSDPKFNAGQVIGVALKNAITSGSKALLVMTLQPYGAIIMATKYAYDKATAIYLENVKSQAGSAKLTPEMDDYLNKITTLLNKQPQVTLTVCGYYTLDDQSALEAQKVPKNEIPDRLYQLAQARQNAVKAGLVQKGVTSNRLTLCHPEQRDEKIPGVSLSI